MYVTGHAGCYRGTMEEKHAIYSVEQVVIQLQIVLHFPGVYNTYTKFTYNRLDLSFSIPKVFLRTPSYQPMQKFIILAVANYLQICCSYAKTYKLSHVSGTVYMFARVSKL